MRLQGNFSKWQVASTILAESGGTGIYVPLIYWGQSDRIV